MSVKRSIIAGIGALIVALSVASQAPTYASVTGSLAHAAHKTVKAQGSGGIYRFAPKKITVKVGTKITWTNTTDAPHTVTSDTPTWTFNKSLDQGKTVHFVFKKAGTYKYHCTIHPSMVGTIVVKH